MDVTDDGNLIFAGHQVCAIWQQVESLAITLHISNDSLVDD